MPLRSPAWTTGAADNHGAEHGGEGARDSPDMTTTAPGKSNLSFQWTQLSSPKQLWAAVSLQLADQHLMSYPSLPSRKTGGPSVGETDEEM